MKYIILIGIISIIGFSGCNIVSDKDTQIFQQNEDEEDKQDMNKPLITKEYLIENCGITEEDLEGIDVEAFISKYKLDEESVKKINVKKTLERFKENNRYKVSSYEYLINAKYMEQKISENKYDSIKILAFYITRGTYQESILFDFDGKNAYWGKEINLLSVWDNQISGMEIDENKKVKIEKVLNENEIAAWNLQYEGTSEGTTGSFGWSLYFELDDGTIYKYSGNGVQGESKPAQWDRFEEELKQIFEE